MLPAAEGETSITCGVVINADIYEGPRLTTGRGLLTESQAEYIPVACVLITTRHQHWNEIASLECLRC
jgi:hypothetical protein